MNHIRNERIKLLAGFLNALAIGLIGIAVLRPVIEVGPASYATLTGWSFAGLALLGISHDILGYLRQEPIITLFDIIVPVSALTIACAGVLVVRATHKPDDLKSHPGE